MAPQASDMLNDINAMLKVGWFVEHALRLEGGMFIVVYERDDAARVTVTQEGKQLPR